MPRPTFLIVGAQKAASSTLRDYLRQHPDIAMQAQELHYFDKHYSKGEEWYLSNFAEARGRAIGEKTPTYSYLPEIPARIHAFDPSLTLVWIFREPVARAYSGYWHSVRAGNEDLSFAETYYRREELKDNPWRRYVYRSHYAEQLERFLAYYPLEGMHFMLFENLLRDPDKTVRALYRALGVRDDIPLPSAIHEHASSYPRYPQLNRYLKGSPESFRRRLAEVHRVFRYKKMPEMERGLKGELLEYFKPHNKRLAELTGLDLSVWNKVYPLNP